MTAKPGSGTITAEIEEIIRAAYRKGYDQGLSDGFNGWAEDPDDEERSVGELILELTSEAAKQ